MTQRFLRQVQLIEMIHFDMQNLVTITYTHKHGSDWEWDAYHNEKHISHQDSITVQDMDIDAMMRTARASVAQLPCMRDFPFEESKKEQP